MKTLLRFGFFLGLLTAALACGNEKACVTNSDCGGGLNFCENGTCKTSPGATLVLDNDAGALEAGDSPKDPTSDPEASPALPE
ncbi:MAG: hypothetical protein U1F66_04485 [bacterium]